MKALQVTLMCNCKLRLTFNGYSNTIGFDLFYEDLPLMPQGLNGTYIIATFPISKPSIVVYKADIQKENVYELVPTTGTPSYAFKNVENHIYCKVCKAVLFSLKQKKELYVLCAYSSDLHRDLACYLMQALMTNRGTLNSVIIENEEYLTE